MKKLENIEEEVSQQLVNSQNSEEDLDESSKDKTNEEIMMDIKKKPVPKGILQEDIAGTNVDWSDLERYVLNINPADMKSCLMQDEARLWTEYQKYKSPLTAKLSKTSLYILIAVMAVILIIGIAIMFVPGLLGSLTGGG